MYCIAEPVSEERAEEIQNSKSEQTKEFERNVVGINRADPEVQAEWQDIQDRVDEEVDEDVAVRESEPEAESNIAESRPTAPTTEDNADEIEAEAEIRTEAQDDNTDSAEHSASSTDTTTAESTPLAVWTLVVRSRVNGAYVDRPTNLTPSDNWSIEYHIKEISDPSKQQSVYKAIQKRRKELIGKEKEERNAGLEQYRRVIKTFSTSGRKWREEQDRIDDELGTRVFRPLGPGSEGEKGGEEGKGIEKEKE